tara:strand:+ start:460 stop:1059 length:600 start_codon:yes stop_codon:yes gene_type:complete
MAKPIVISYKGKESSFDHGKLDRAKLYGKKKRVALDSNDELCIKASLIEDGSTLIRSGMTAQGYFKSDGAWVPNKELVGLDETGKPLELLNSTLGVAQTVDGPASAWELLDLEVTTVYLLEPQEVAPNLEKELGGGEIIKIPFNYRSDYRLETGFLLKNKDGYFCIVGVPTHPEWSELQKVAAEVFEEEDSGDLDFDMF